jgi:serine/threonine protein phosphatase PrpC
LEDNKYAKLLRRLKELPNPSDNSAGDGEDDDNADKKVYTRFDPTDPQWESEDEGTTASVTPTISRASSVDGANGKKPKKLISKKEAVELFTQLLLEENAARAGQPLPGGSGSARERLLARGQSGSGDDSGDDSGYQQAWEEYFYDPDRIPGDRPRPTQQYRSASISVGDSETDRQCTLREHKVQAGCTAVVALREGNLLYCANAGDSRGVLCREDGKVLALSEDHKPTASTEMKRILDAGGFISSAGRINGNLNLSRSLGDMKYKQVPNLLPSEQIITAEPDITVNEILPGDKFFVLACDGVWDVFENQEICDFIDLRLSSGKSVEAIVEDVFEHCVSDDPRRTQGIGGDNMTCMIILLNQ